MKIFKKILAGYLPWCFSAVAYFFFSASRGGMMKATSGSLSRCFPDAVFNRSMWGPLGRFGSEAARAVETVCAETAFGQSDGLDQRFEFVEAQAGQSQTLPDDFHHPCVFG